MLGDRFVEHQSNELALTSQLYFWQLFWVDKWNEWLVITLVLPGICQNVFKLTLFQGIVFLFECISVPWMTMFWNSPSLSSWRRHPLSPDDELSPSTKVYLVRSKQASSISFTFGNAVVCCGHHMSMLPHYSIQWVGFKTVDRGGK